jgi:CRISPR/Cas system-associated exonuclease Cas4 (RecB family)
LRGSMIRLDVATLRKFEATGRYAFPALKSEYAPSGRIYTTPEGRRYPSVTTVLGQYDKEWLEKWRADVGEEFAREYSERAASRGTRVHSYAEDYVTGKMHDTSYVIWGFNDLETFQKLKRALDAHLGRVHAMEATLYSDSMQMAGRLDMIGDWDGEEAVIDFKSSAKEKDASMISSYFAQLAAYSLMVQERSGKKIDKLVVVMPCDELPSCQVFVTRRSRAHVDYLAAAMSNFTEKEAA